MGIKQETLPEIPTTERVIKSTRNYIELIYVLQQTYGALTRFGLNYFIAKIFKLPLFFVQQVVFLELNNFVKPIFEKCQTQHLISL